VAAVHAGWRGTVQQIVVRALERMHERFGTDAADVHAAIGPGIGVCCYEVGPDVAAQFGLNGRAHVDLAQANADQLARAGVLSERVHLAGRCTMCESAIFHSFRRDGEASGRMHSFIGVK
jgi:copper oxidase (laccase) domain-containing protein